MYKTMSALILAVILVNLSAHAKALPIRRAGSATSLQNIQSRTTQQELPRTSRVTSDLPKGQSKDASATRDLGSFFGLGNKLDIRVGSRSSRSLSGVFPQENTLESGGVRVLYKLNQ